jgi:GT2 family glycosyltransferase
VLEDSQIPRPGEDTPSIAVVIVTFNSGDVLADCLRSVGSSQGVHLAAVVVADNASRDDSVAIAEAATELPIQVVRMGRNAGYAAAINAGVATLDTRKLRAVFVMNPDCRVRPDTLRRLAGALRQPGRGIVAPRLINPDGSLQPTLRRAPTVPGALAEAILGGNLAGRIGLGELVFDEGSHSRPGPAAWTTGAAMFISTDVIHDIGPWDESFLLYSEETEYALRAADRGWTLWYEPEAVVEHIGGESGTNPALSALLVANKVLLFRRRRGRIASTGYFLAMVSGEGIRALAGRRTARASVAALVRRGRREQIMRSIAGEPTP